MTNSNFKRLVAGVALAALAASAGVAAAQGAVATHPTAAAAGAPPAAAIPAGPAIPYVCVFSNEGALGNSAVGKYVGQRMQQLQGQANAEVTAEKTAIETDARALDAQKAALSTDVVQQRTLALNQRAQALQRKAELRSHELEATEQKALSRVGSEMSPLLQQVYGQRGCGLLLDRNAVFASNPTMDVTPDVVRLLDVKITQFPFDREHLDQQAAAAPGAAPAPARPR